jgi:hypothetical protein
VVEVFHNAGGTDAAISVARQRRGTHFDPQVVDVFAAEATSLFTGLEASGWDAVIAAEPALEARLTDAEFEAVQPLQRLHGGLSGPGSANLSGHDLTVFGGRLLPDKTWSRSANRRPSHRVTPDAEDEQPSLANQPPGQQEDLLSQLHGVHGDTGSDLPDQRHLHLVAAGPVGWANGSTIVRGRGARTLVLHDRNMIGDGDTARSRASAISR